MPPVFLFYRSHIHHRASSELQTLNLRDSLANKSNWASTQRMARCAAGAHSRARKKEIDELINADHLQSARLLTGNY